MTIYTSKGVIYDIFPNTNGDVSTIAGRCVMYYSAEKLVKYIAVSNAFHNMDNITDIRIADIIINAIRKAGILKDRAFSNCNILNVHKRLEAMI